MKSFRIHILICFDPFISMFGTAMTGFALGVWFLEQNGSSSSYSTILASILTPSILITRSLLPNCALKNSIIADIIGIEEGRSIALMFVISAITVILLSGLAFRSKQIWNIDTKIPDKR